MCYLDDLAQLMYMLSLKQLKTSRPVIAAANVIFY
ncbi:MAG: hypothetical protein ACD_45C00297G0004 [uncultured bacterium]|nr:MAG: hypothetical protein ACD_45C00297G0004 [uncultured bacterium]